MKSIRNPEIIGELHTPCLLHENLQVKGNRDHFHTFGRKNLWELSLISMTRSFFRQLNRSEKAYFRFLFLVFISIFFSGMRSLRMILHPFLFFMLIMLTYIHTSYLHRINSYYPAYKHIIFIFRNVSLDYVERFYEIVILSIFSPSVFFRNQYHYFLFFFNLVK
jgi:hypothetical protein